MKYAFLIICFLLSVLAKADVIHISNQEDFDKIAYAISKRLKDGQTRIDVKFKPGQYYFKEAHIKGAGWNYPNVTLNFVGYGSVLIPVGNKYTNLDNIYNGGNPEKSCWINESLVEISGWSDTYQSISSVDVLDMKAGQCRIKSPVSVADYIYNERFPISILITEWYLGATYKVDRIKDSYVYFTVPDLQKTSLGFNVNWDYGYGQQHPRFRFFNALFLNDGRVDMKSCKSLYECTASSFLDVSNSSFNKISIKGLSFVGNADGKSLIDFSSVKANNIVLYGCRFRYIHGSCIGISNTANVLIKKCYFEDCQSNGIMASNTSRDVQILSNRFLRVGKNLTNSRVITVAGENFIVRDNYIQDFCYAAIGVGVWYGTKKDNRCSGIIERNEICYSSEYFDNAWKYTLMDAGAIYTFTKMDDVTIRGNYIHDFTGVKDYRGIFCDDGAQNIKIYGNILNNIKSSYDIDLRYTSAANVAKYVPDFNTNNLIYGNIMDGYYRFEGIPDKDDRCVHRSNYLVGDGSLQKSNSVKNLQKQDEDVFLSGKSSVCVGKENIRLLKKTDNWKYYKRYNIK